MTSPSEKPAWHSRLLVSIPDSLVFIISTSAPNPIPVLANTSKIYFRQYVNKNVKANGKIKFSFDLSEFLVSFSYFFVV